MVIAGVGTTVLSGVGVEFRHHVQTALPIVHSQAPAVLEPDETGKTIRDGAVAVILETRLGPRGTSLEFAILAGAGARDLRPGRIVTPRLTSSGQSYRDPGIPPAIRIVLVTVGSDQLRCNGISDRTFTRCRIHGAVGIPVAIGILVPSLARMLVDVAIIAVGVVGDIAFRLIAGKERLVRIAEGVLIGIGVIGDPHSFIDVAVAVVVDPVTYLAGRPGPGVAGIVPPDTIGTGFDTGIAGAGAHPAGGGPRHAVHHPILVIILAIAMFQRTWVYGVIVVVCIAGNGGQLCGREIAFRMLARNDVRLAIGIPVAIGILVPWLSSEFAPSQRYGIEITRTDSLGKDMAVCGQDLDRLLILPDTRRHIGSISLQFESDIPERNPRITQRDGGKAIGYRAGTITDRADSIGGEHRQETDLSPTRTAVGRLVEHDGFEPIRGHVTHPYHQCRCSIVGLDRDEQPWSTGEWLAERLHGPSARGIQVEEPRLPDTAVTHHVTPPLHRKIGNGLDRVNIIGIIPFLEAHLESGTVYIPQTDHPGFGIVIRWGTGDDDGGSIGNGKLHAGPGIGHIEGVHEDRTAAIRRRRT